MVSIVPAPLHRAAYRAQHISMLLNCLAAHRVMRTVARRNISPPAGAVTMVRKRYYELLDRDLANVEAGLYPKKLLFQFPFVDYAKQIPQLARDVPRSMRRMRKKNWKDLPGDVDLRRYPAYFRRNFHWQTDGYLSKRSAELYDIGVELLFLGTADVMRRQIIPDITRHLRARPESNEAPRLLDVACGTGRALRQIAIAQPDLRLYGVDLSPYYLQVARELLADVPDVSLVAENGESLPFRDSYFDIVTSVYLFHELPRNARRNVIREMLRVLKPGGLLILEDSAQVVESAPIAFFLEAFSRDFHEPFYPDYLHDDLEGAVRESGFESVAGEPVFVSKVVTARKPS